MWTLTSSEWYVDCRFARPVPASHCKHKLFISRPSVLTLQSPQFLAQPRAWRLHPFVTRVTPSNPSPSSSTAGRPPATSFNLDFTLPPLSAPFSFVASLASFLVGDIASHFTIRMRVRSMPRAERGGLTVELIRADWRIRRSDAAPSSSVASSVLPIVSLLRAWLPATGPRRSSLNGTVVWTAWPFSPQGDPGIHVNQELSVRARKFLPFCSLNML